MILSRTLAKRRIAHGTRPSWLAAWAPVAFDAAFLVVIFVLAFRPFQMLVQAFDMPTWAIALSLLLLGFIPIQGVLIFSSLWAAKSRWTDMEQNQ